MEEVVASQRGQLQMADPGGMAGSDVGKGNRPSDGNGDHFRIFHILKSLVLMGSLEWSIEEE